MRRRRNTDLYAVGDGIIIGAPALRLFVLVLKAFLCGNICSSKAASDECDAGVPGVGGQSKNPQYAVLIGGGCPQAVAPTYCVGPLIDFPLRRQQQPPIAAVSTLRADFLPWHGLLGTQSLDDDNSAAGLTTLILRIQQDLCTPLSGGPFDKSSRYRK